ncbi:MAG: HD domain-containing protein [Clostridia bacterium]|nr:HD domain-containing protein [Clostridia bacterium]
MNITESMLDTLREKVSATMSPKRFRHTAEVEKMAEYLGGLYAPQHIPRLRAAALLHDITKEYTTELQLKICAERDIPLDADAVFAPKTLHARTAAALIPEQYPEFADGVIISSVRWHTTGRADMSICERIIYLADYIDMSRTFEDCVRLREYFMSARPEELGEEERMKHLTKTLIMSFDMTVQGLLSDRLPISRDTVEARNSLIRELMAEG